MNAGATNGGNCEVMGVRHSCLRYVGGPYVVGMSSVQT